MASRPSNRAVTGFSTPDNPVTGPRFGRPVNFNIESEKAPPPVDDEGIEMLSNHEVGEAFGWNNHNSKQISYKKPIKHYKVYPTKDFEENSENTGQGARTWFPLSEVVDHLKAAAKTDPAKFQAAHAFHSNRLKQARQIEKARIKKGGEVFNITNQPHPANKVKGFKGPDIRAWTDEREGMTKGPLSPVGTGKLDSNLDNPFKYGRFTTVEDRGNPS